MLAKHKPLSLVASYGGTSANHASSTESLELDAEMPALQATILIVDDEPNNRFAFSTVLEELGENIVSVSSGTDALRFLLHNDCAVILLDVHMPDMDGYETAELIRSREKSRGIPIIFISAINKDDSHVARAYGLGAVDYVFKPVDTLILRAKIAVFIELYKRTAEVRRQGLLERRLLEENLRVRAEKLEAERALRRVEEQQANIVASLPIALYSVNANDGFRGPRYLGERISQAVGFQPAQFIDADFWVSRIHPADTQRVNEEVHKMLDTGAMSIEYRWLCADGSQRSFLDRAVLIRDEAGRPQEIFGSCLDVTERRHAEQRLFQSQKMEAVGQLTGGLAHDFNNMLTVVIGNLDALGRSLQGSGRNSDRVQMALTGAMSCAELTRRLLAFACKQPLQPSTLDFSSLIVTVAKLLERTLGEKTQIEVKLAEDLWHGVADAAQLESALMNLAVNARDAMPEGGSLLIEAKNVCLQHDENELITTLDGDYILLTVSDTGCGMPPEVIQRVFEPFFTTKKLGRGSGLGLSMVYGFVKQSGGDVKIESTVDHGTAVHLYFPRSTAQADQRVPISPDRNKLTIAGRGRTILLVEDDAGVLAVTAALLHELEFTVLEASDGVKALQTLRANSANIDLLFTDIVMPGGMSGIELVARAREIRPDLRVLLTSGYSESFMDGEHHGPLLTKPYREADLLLKLTQLFATEA